MKYGEIIIAHSYAYLLPIGDIHLGDRNANTVLLKENIDWVKNEKYAYVFLMGDILNCATRSSPSNPFYQNLDLNEQINLAIELFKPIKEKILGCISGNHEQRLSDYAGLDVLAPLCLALNIKYYGLSGAIAFKVGKTKANTQIYTGYFHHTTGGGDTAGGKVNRVAKLRELVSNADFYCGGHNHQLGVIPTTTRTIDVHNKTIRVKRQLIVDCGSYLDYEEGYAEQKMLTPTKLGSPRIRLSGEPHKKDIHCSI